MPTIHEFKSVDDYYSYTIIESNGIYKAFVTCQSAEKGIYRKDQLGKKEGYKSMRWAMNAIKRFAKGNRALAEE